MELPLPPKKVFGNMGREFIAERQQSLQKYLNLILMHHLLSGSIYIKRFLDPTKYPTDLQGECVVSLKRLNLRGLVYGSFNDNI